MAFKFKDISISVPQKANYDLSHAVRATMAPGVVYPVLTKEMLPGDHFRISFNTLIQTMATLTPVLGSLKVRFDVFTSDLANYYAFMDNNDNTGGDALLSASRDTFYIAEDLSRYVSESNLLDLGSFVDDYGEISDKVGGIRVGVGEGSLLNWLGFPVGASSIANRDEESTQYCADRVLTYYDIIRNYYVNNQSNHVPVFVKGYNPHWMDGYNVKDSSSIQISDMDVFYRELRCIDEAVNLSYVEEWLSATSFTSFISDVLTKNHFDTDNSQGQHFSSGYFGTQCPGCGLVPAQFGADYFTSLLDSGKINNNKQYVQVQNSRFAVDTLIFADQMQGLMNRLNLSGGRFGDFLYSLFGTSNSRKLDIPEYHGSHYMSIDFQDIIATAPGTQLGADIAVGDVAGRGEGRSQSSVFDIRTSNHSILMVMCTLVPRVDYYQGIDRELQKIHFADLFNPMLARLPFQPVNGEQLYNQTFSPFKPDNMPYELSEQAFDFLESNGYVMIPGNERLSTVGMLPAWAEYQTSDNRLVGKLATDMRFWAFGRNFRQVSHQNFGSLDAPYFRDYRATYVDPISYNNIFADADDQAENFIVQIGFNIHARRPVGNTLPPKY